MIKSTDLLPTEAPSSKGDVLVPNADGMVKVNLRDDVVINGQRYGRGAGVLVPLASYDVWKHAL